jgi:hypothetical protein
MTRKYKLPTSGVLPWDIIDNTSYINDLLNNDPRQKYIIFNKPNNLSSQSNKLYHNTKNK